MSYIVNAFSLNMVASLTGSFNVNFEPIAPADIPRDVQSGLGHDDIVYFVNKETGLSLVKNRCNNEFSHGDIFYIAQYIGPRLEEGATTLPDNSTIKYFKVTIE